MAWDSTRPVPWRRLTREWLIYVVIMAAVFVIFMRDSPLLGIMAGLLVSGPLYLLFGAVLAKFGYTRKSLKELRTDTPVQSSSGTLRAKPAPTKRTSGSGAAGQGGQRSKRR